MDWLFGWVYDLLYTLQKSICYLLDFIKEIFNKLAGIDTVTINGNQEDLLSHFLLSDSVKNAFLGVFLVAVILLFVFVIIAIIKTETSDPQHKKTKGQILVKALQSFVIFLIIPFLLLAGILLTNAIMGAINSSMSGAMIDGNSNTLIGGQILVTSGHDAYKGDEGSRQAIERMFVTGQLDYNNLNVVKQYYNLGDLNFFVGIIGGLSILIMFVLSAIMFIQRIFDIILLYIISPASVSTLPLDDGGRFRIWREMLISKVLAAYGIILSMNLFFLIIPQISQISFFDNSFKDGVVQLLFVLGGAFAITKANMVIAQLTGNNAGAQEAQQMLSNIHSGIHMARSAGHAVAGATGMIIGGMDFMKNRKHGASFGESVSSSIHSQRNRHDDHSDKNNPNSGGFCGDDTNTPKYGVSVQEASENKSQKETTDDPTNVRAANDVSDIANTLETDISKTPTQAEEMSDTVTGVSDNEKKDSHAGQIVKGATRLATLPAGIVKDLIQGGVITAGKNFVPRVKNILQGNSIVNHAIVKKPLEKAKPATDTAKEDKK